MPDPVLASAEDAARRAADAAGLRIRELTELSGFEAACQLFDEIWQPDPADRPMTPGLMRALTKAGSYVAGAYRGEVLTGASVGFLGPPADRALHSHITGVRDTGEGAGYAMKLHQRAWALAHGVTEIAWTYDPLIRRNAYFNLVKLGARPAEYLPNFYGGMQDGINGGDDTDRLLVRWDLLSPPVVGACGGTFSPASAAAVRAGGAVTVLSVAADGGPAAGRGLADGGPAVADGRPRTERLPLPAGAGLLVAVPADIEKLRATDPALASAWRAALRDVLRPAMAAGARITGFDRTGWYVMEESE
jgi:predicted GNAT superfamily acetyltransferase